MLGILLIAAFLGVSGSSIDSKHLCYLLNCKAPTSCAIKDVKCQQDKCPKMVFCAKDLVERTLGISDCDMVRCSDGYSCVSSLEHCILGMCTLASCIPAEEADIIERRHEIVHYPKPEIKEENILMQGKPTFELDYFTSVPLNRKSWRKSGLAGPQPHIVEYSVDYFGDRFIVPLDTLENKTVDLRRIRSSLDYLNLLKQLSQAHAKVLQKNKKVYGSQHELTPGCRANNCNVRYNLHVPQRTDFHNKMILENQLVGSHSMESDTVLSNTTGSLNGSKSLSKESGEKKSKHCCANCCADCKNTTQHTSAVASLTDGSYDHVNTSHCCHYERSHAKCPDNAVNPHQVPGEQSDASIPTHHHDSEKVHVIHEGSKSVESTQGTYCHEKQMECCSATDLTTPSTNDAQLLKVNQEVPVSLDVGRDVTESQKVLEHESESKMETIEQAVKIEKLNMYETGQFSQNGSVSEQKINTDPHKDVLMKGSPGLQYQKTENQSKNSSDSISLRGKNSTELCNGSPNSTCDLMSKEVVANGTDLEKNVNEFNLSKSDTVLSGGAFLHKELKESLPGNLSLADNNPSFLQTNKSLPELSTASILSSQYSHEAFLKKDNITFGEDNWEENDTVLTHYEFKTTKCPECSNETQDDVKNARKRESPNGFQSNPDAISQFAPYAQFDKFPEIIRMIKKQLKKSNIAPSKMVLPRKFQRLERLAGLSLRRVFKHK